MVDGAERFERALNRHKAAVYRQMVRLCGNHADAEDALGEAIFSAFRAMRQLDDEERFRAWLATIATRSCLRMKRSQGPLAKALSLVETETTLKSDADVGKAMEEREWRSCVHAAVDALPEKYRVAYELRDLKGLSGEEAAQALGISLAALKSRLHRARQIVRENLDRSLCGTAFEP
ncbi:MAG: RNA polymerase sigma factor [Fimbriimonadaceae bacterium]